MTPLSYSAYDNYLFDRRYSLEIIPFGQTQGVVYGNENNNAANLRVQFDIERSFSSAADKGKITIYNLTPQNRNAITRGCVVRLRAGYRSRVRLLFTGVVRKVQTDQNGPDTVTSLECGDAEPSITYASVNRSYKQDVSLAQVLQDFAKDLQIEIGGNVVEVAPGVIKGIPDQTIPAGTVFSGPVKMFLDLLLKSQYIDWSVHNDKLVILPSWATLYASVEIVSKQTGMTGTPSFTEKALKFDSLLNTALIPGALVQLISDNKRLTGYYKVRSAKFAGDTHEQSWNVSCEAVALKEPLPVVASAIGNNFSTAVMK